MFLSNSQVTCLHLADDLIRIKITMWLAAIFRKIKEHLPCDYTVIWIKMTTGHNHLRQHLQNFLVHLCPLCIIVFCL